MADHSAPTRLAPPGSHSHVVEFYETDAYLVRGVSGFMAEGLADGATIVVVATGEHRRLFGNALAAIGVDLAAQAALGRYVALDAGEMLAAFMEDRLPDPERFDEIIGGLVRHAARRGRPVRIYGEMVACLWTDGRVNAALALEDLWNDLATRLHFDLFCAYPVGVFDSDASAAPFRRVCEQHTRVLPSEGCTHLPEPTHLREAAELPESRQQGRLEETVAELQRVDALRSGLVSTLAHDVRSPLTVISGVLEALLDTESTADPERRQELLLAAQRQARRLSRLAEGLLTLARLEQGRLELYPEDVPLAAAVATTLDHLPGGEAFRVSVHPSMVVRADPARLDQVVYNLAQNALRYGRAPFSIEAVPRGGRVTIRVRDHGDGVPAERRAQLFEPFGMPRSHTSVGFGLAVARMMAEANGGTLSYRDDGGPGACFELGLPLARIAATA